MSDERPTIPRSKYIGERNPETSSYEVSIQEHYASRQGRHLIGVAPGSKLWPVEQQSTKTSVITPPDPGVVIHFDVDVEEKVEQWPLFGAQNGFHIGGLPPDRPALQC